MHSFKTFLFSLLALSVCLTSCKDKSISKQKEKEQEAFEAFERSARELQAENRRQHASEEGISADPKKLDKMIDVTKRLEESSTGEDAKLAKIMHLFMKNIQNDMKDFATYQEGFTEGTDYGQIKSVADIDLFSKKVNDYRAANKTLKEKIQTQWLSFVKDNLKKENLTGKNATDFLRGFENKLKLQLPYMMKVRSTDDELCEVILTQHTILKKYWGKWNWNAEEEVPDFEDNDAIETYNEAARTIQRIREEQHEAQQKLIDLQ